VSVKAVKGVKGVKGVRAAVATARGQKVLFEDCFKQRVDVRPIVAKSGRAHTSFAAFAAFVWPARERKVRGPSPALFGQERS
jgi:hypothetical protein